MPSEHDLTSAGGDTDRDEQLVVYVSRPEYADRPELIDSDPEERQAVGVQLGRLLHGRMTGAELRVATGQFKPPILLAPALEFLGARVVWSGGEAS